MQPILNSSKLIETKIQVTKEFNLKVFSDNENNLYLNLTDLKVLPETSQLANRQEMRLTDLGRFPLKQEDHNWLDKKIENFIIPKIFKDSNIPIFLGTHEKNKTAIIPEPSKNICHYFHDLWKPMLELNESQDDQLAEVIAGFLILYSFCGDQI